MAGNDSASTPYNCTVPSGTPSRVISLSERPITTVTLLSVRFTPNRFATRDPILFFIGFLGYRRAKKKKINHRQAEIYVSLACSTGERGWTRKPFVSGADLTTISFDFHDREPTAKDLAGAIRVFDTAILLPRIIVFLSNLQPPAVNFVVYRRKPTSFLKFIVRACWWIKKYN